MIYFARRPNGIIKIGSTLNIQTRIKWLNVQYGEVEIIGVMDGGNKQEKILHKHFAKLNAGGDGIEWFHPGDELLDYIAKYATPLRVSRPLMPLPTALNAKVPITETTLAIFKDFIAGLDTTYDEALRFMLSNYIESGERPLLAGKRNYDKFTEYLCKFVSNPSVPTISKLDLVSGESQTIKPSTDWQAFDTTKAKKTKKQKQP